jgi:teichuronic acid biosynthesis glycosyltransferase TuaG
MKPMVSVITPVFNGEKYIEECIKSILSQEFTDFELIVVNDFSTDSTADLLNLFEDSRIIILNNDKNLGVVESRNNAINFSSGKYIAFLDADDTWHKKKLTIQISKMEETGVAISSTSYRKVNEKGLQVGLVSVPKEISSDLILIGNIIGCSTVIYNTEILGKKRFKEYKLSEDFILWYEILEETGICLGLNIPLTNYRVVNESRSSDKMKVIKYQWYIYRKIFKLSLFKSLHFYVVYLIKGYLRYKN